MDKIIVITTTIVVPEQTLAMLADYTANPSHHHHYGLYDEEPMAVEADLIRQFYEAQILTSNNSYTSLGPININCQSINAN